MATGLKLAVVGCRDFYDYDTVKQKLDSIPGITCIVSGGATGVDASAKRYAEENNLEYIEFPADWSKGRAAGPIRNKQIVNACDELIAFWDGESKGTKSAVGLATGAKKLREIVTVAV